MREIEKGIYCRGELRNAGSVRMHSEEFNALSVQSPSACALSELPSLSESEGSKPETKSHNKKHFKVCHTRDRNPPCTDIYVSMQMVVSLFLFVYADGIFSQYLPDSS